MYCDRRTYTDFDGNVRTENFYFNLTEADLLKLEVNQEGGLAEYLQAIIDAKDTKQIMNAYMKIIDVSYGEKDPTGKYLVKNDTVLAKYHATQAYSDLYIELLQNGDKGAAFIAGITPKKTKIEAPVVPPNISPLTPNAVF